MRSHEPPAKLLTIGGSDSGGAAGIQADLKTFSALGAYGMSALTVVTAQNSVAVSKLQFLSPELVASQIQIVLQDYGAEAIKSGFIGQPELVSTIARALDRFEGPIIVDPVLVNHRGEAMFPVELLRAYRQWLLPIATLTTPNWRELLLLAGEEPGARQRIPAAIDHLMQQGVRRLLVSGIHEDDTVVDIYHDGRQSQRLVAGRIDTGNTHGSGDTLSAAVATFLAQGNEMETAINKARIFTQAAIAAGANWQLGAGHGPLAHWLV